MLVWGKENYVNYPWRKSENIFHGLIAEVMLQRTKAEQVDPVYRAFIKRYPNLDAFDEGNDELRSLLQPLGLNWRINMIIELIGELCRLGYVPSTYEDLVKMPGVGDYVASAFISFHLGRRKPIIDSNVVRVFGRILDAKTDNNTRRKKWFRDYMEKITPDKEFKAFNYAILDFAKSVCRPKPRCYECTISSYCGYYQKREC